jgi:peptidoglycan-synthase activator LpoB
MRRRAPCIAAFLAIPVGLASCEGGGSSVLIDPDAFGSDQGTLIAISDVRVVAQEMIGSMNKSERLATLRAARKPIPILIGNLKQRTSIAIFDKEIFLNQLLARLTDADKDGFYRFLWRPAVQTERALQQEGLVTTSPTLGEIAGAELVLNGEIREILSRLPVEGGGVSEKRIVQYTLELDQVQDGAIVWIQTHEIVKEQVIGAVYQ